MLINLEALLFELEVDVLWALVDLSSEFWVILKRSESVSDFAGLKGPVIVFEVLAAPKLTEEESSVVPPPPR